ncbi:MAG: PilX N-terminal domain-containing pilus assembly protein [Gammaproteobacteria bacterium]
MHRMHKQKGAVLVVSIMILLILTFIAVSTLQTSPIEEKIAGNYRDYNVSLQAADTTEREAENYIDSLVDISGFTNSNGLYTTGNAPDPLASVTWSGTATVSATTNLPGIVTPRYFIELIGTYDSGTVSLNIYNYGQDPNTGPVTVFRIVARATGATGTAETIVQSFYGRRF